MIFYLYIKKHNKTGLKYLGQTKQDPYEYSGSGKYWIKHLKKHGFDISTELIAAFDNKEDLKVAGLFWSNHLNIVKSKEWANLKEECGDGGWSANNFTSEKQRMRILKRDKKRPHLIGNKNPVFTQLKNKTHTSIKYPYLLRSIGLKASSYEWCCPHCKKTGKGLGNAKRWHFNNCKESLL